MRFAGPYSVDLMTRVLQGLGPPATHHASQEDPAPSWDKKVRGKPLSLAESSSILSDVVNALDQKPTGWLPPLHPLPHSYSNHNLIPTSITIISDLLKPDTFDCGSPDIRQDGVYPTGSGSPSSTSTSSAFSRFPSPFVPTQGSDMGSEDEVDSFEPSSFEILRKKEKKRIRRSSGVKSKVKTPRARVLRDAGGNTNPNSPLEMVQCQWADCTKRLHVDYINVTHWGKHIREHYANEQVMITCRWDGGCGAVINKSSMWKHVVVHQPKFKIRCPRGCDVSTRSDMMRRHLQSCPQAAKKGESGKEESVDVEGGSRCGDYDGDGEDDEEDGRED